MTECGTANATSGTCENNTEFPGICRILSTLRKAFARPCNKHTKALLSNRRYLAGPFVPYQLAFHLITGITADRSDADVVDSLPVPQIPNII